MLSPKCHDSSQKSSQQEQPLTYEVTVSVKVTAGQSVAVIHLATPNQKTTCETPKTQNVNSTDMTDSTGLLECPMCAFTVLPTDDYVLQLHFEQVHTTDSPFRIEDDAESPPPALPPRPSSKRKHVGDTPSSDEEENTVTCPEPDCGEALLLTDFNEHLDYHAAETLSFDETTGKYHSHHSSATMQGLATHNPQTGFSKSQLLDHSFTTDLPEALKRSHDHDHDHGHGHKLKKHGHRHRSNTNSSEKSTLSRSILTFNPFAKMDKSVKPPNKSARLGVSALLLPLYLLKLIVYRNPSLALMPGKIACPDGYMISWLPVLRLLSSTALAETAASSSRSKFRTKRQASYLSSLNCLLSIVPSRKLTIVTHQPCTLARLLEKVDSAVIETSKCSCLTSKALKLKDTKSFLAVHLVS